VVGGRYETFIRSPAMPNPALKRTASPPLSSALGLTEGTMSVVLIIVGFIIARFGAGLFIVGEASGGQSTGGGIITLIVQLAGWALVIWGLVLLFT